MDELINKTLGQFQIVRELGRGGMAVVYEAYQPALQRRVAIKVLSRHLTHDQAFIQRFRQEAIAAANLKHPHIITIYDVGQSGDFNYIVMELLEGYPLADLVKQGPMNSIQVSKIIEQVASALDYAHQQGFVHRDIKPSNIMLAQNEHATLMDFGIAKALSGAHLTQTGATIGTPEFMSPEQITGEPVDGRTDVYALGIVAFEMLTGQVPFSGATATVLYKQANTPPPPMRSLLPTLSPAIESVVLRALAKRPNERFATAGQFAQALTAAVAGQPSRQSFTRPTQVPPTRAASAWLPWALVGGGALAMICLVVIIATLLLNPGGQTPPTTAPSTLAPTEVIRQTTSTQPLPTSQPNLTTPKPQPTPMYGWPYLIYATGPNGAWQVMLADLSTGSAAPLPNQPADSGVPAWSRDHQQVAFRSKADGTWQVYIMNANGANLRKLTQTGGNYEPNWAPDGIQLAYVSDRDGNKEVHLTDINQSKDIRLTNNSVLDDDPNWSPDGQWILVERREDDCYNLYAIRPDGTDEYAITNSSGENCVWATTPAWSPDGNYIAYERSEHGERFHIWIMEAGGANPRALTTGSHNDVRPTWSPDGKWIAFSSDRGGDNGIYIVQANGGQPKRIDTSGGFDPAW